MNSCGQKFQEYLAAYENFKKRSINTNLLPRSSCWSREVFTGLCVCSLCIGTMVAPACSVAGLFILIAGNFLLYLPAVESQCTTSCSCPKMSRCCLTVAENEPANTLVGIYDIFEDPAIYSIGVANGGELFEIDSNGTIRTRIELDREGSYNSRLTDGKRFDRNEHCFNLDFSIDSGGSRFFGQVAIQILDVNDNPPRFSQDSFTINLPESEGNSSTPLNCGDDNTRSKFSGLVATDSDDSSSGAMYFVEGDLFSLPSPNYPCVQGTGLDRDVPPSSYSFTLIAQDAGNSSLRSTTNVTFVLSDINDNYPNFTTDGNATTIDESLAVGSVVYRFEASDIDFGINGTEGIVYSISGSSAFSINRGNGTITLDAMVNAESVSEYPFTVTATDKMGMLNSKSSRKDFTISVNDINEPGMVTIHFQNSIVPEDSSPQGSDRELIAVVLLDDPDRSKENKNNGATISVSSDCDRTSSNNRCSHFYVTSKFFEETQLNRFNLMKNGSLDREEESFISIVINITEGGNPTLYQSVTINVTVEDVNDNSPNLNKTSFTVREESAFIIDLSNYTYDRDSGENGAIASYSLVSAKSGNKTLTERFGGWLSSSGLLSPASGSKLDREEDGRIITFVVNITDAGVPPMSNLVSFTLEVQDENDNPPTFPQQRYTFHVMENSPTGTRVGMVEAVDPDQDSGSASYSFSSSSSDFSINQMTGELFTNKTFDREVGESTFLLEVVASDGTLHSKTAIVIVIDDVNDNDPYFTITDFKFSVKTSLAVGELVGQILAKDNDSTAENSVIIFKIQDSPTFSIKSNTSGDVILKTDLLLLDYTFTVSVFNPGREEFNSTITVSVTVVEASTLSMTLIIVIAATGLFFLILIVIVSLLLAFIFWKNKKSRRQLKLQEESRLNNMQTSILKIPASALTTNGNGTVGGKSSRVTFKERVEETHYDEETSVINSTTNTIKKESVTKFGSPQIRHNEESCEALSPVPLSPMSSSSPNGKTGHPLASGPGGGATIAVVDLEMSPRQGMNGDINGRCQFNMHPRRSPPIPRMAPGGGSAGTARGHTTAAEMMVYSQGTSSDGHTSAHELDDESMYSDDASIVNTHLSRFSNGGRQDISSYDGGSSHPHMELHRHLPPISHNQHNHSSSLAQLHAFNLAQLGKTTSTETRPHHYSPMLSPDDNDLTANDEDMIHHTNTISTQSSLHTSTATPINHVGVSAGSNHEHTNGGRNYAHPPLVMPDAFPRDTAEVHRFPMGSFVDYGEASTYASTELDEALGFNEPEPGIISLTATTEYDDTQL